LNMSTLTMSSDEVYTMTPQGHIVVLPKKSTPVDFAFAIHTEVGNHCTGARVNGQIVPLKYALKNGDTVKILTHPNQRPNPDWLKFVQTSRARTKIRQYVRREQRERNRQYGKELLDKEFKRYHLSIRKLQREGQLDALLRACKCQTLDELYINLGYGKIQAETVIRKALPEQEVSSKTEQEEGRLERLMRTAADAIRGRKTGVALDGIEDVMVRYAKCCSPVPGEPIVGFVSRGRGLAIHAADCTKLQHLESDRFIDVYWEANAKDAMRPVTLRVYSDDRAGMLASISQTFTGAKINISEAHCRTQEDGSAINTFEVMIADSAQLKGVIKEIERLKGVHHVSRVRA
ncbi:MAG: TGS domain-containing protein, partial [Myxococcota bacterium]